MEKIKKCKELLAEQIRREEERKALEALENAYNAAMEDMAQGNYAQAAMALYPLGDYKDARLVSFDLWGAITVRTPLAAGYSHTVARQADGTVVAIGDNTYGQCDVGNWTNIAPYKTALKESLDEDTNAKQYAEAVALMNAERYTEALAASEKLADYQDSKKKFAQCQDYLYGELYNEATSLMQQGKTAQAAIAFGKCGDYKDAKAKSFDLWSQLSGRTTIIAGESILGLKTDGTVVVAGRDLISAYSAENWTDIVAISSGFYSLVGLKADGTVVICGSNLYGQYEALDWTDIAIP